MKNDIKYIKIHDIPFKFLTFEGKAASLRIGESKQKVFIPRVYFNNDGTLKDGVNLDWWFYKSINQHKIDLFKSEVERNERTRNITTFKTNDK